MAARSGKKVRRERHSVYYRLELGMGILSWFPGYADMFDSLFTPAKTKGSFMCSSEDTATITANEFNPL